jgi:putative inorganic carbon (hco3(-)) transporter
MFHKIAQIIFLVLIISLPLVRPFNFTFRGLLIPFTDFIFLLCCGAFAIALIRREVRLVTDRVFVPILLFAGALTISAAFSAEPERSAVKLAGHFYLLGLAVLTIQFARDPVVLKRIIYAWLAATILVVLAALIGIAMFYAGHTSRADNYFLYHYGSLPATGFPRVMSLFANANMLCNYLNVSLMMTLAAMSAKWIRPLFSWILLAGIGITALFTVSPGIGGLALSLGLWVWLTGSTPISFIKPRFAIAFGVLVAAAVLAAALIAPPKLPGVDSPPGSEPGYSIGPSVRLLTWKSALNTFLDHPLTGKGTGTDAALVYYTTVLGQNQVLLDAHNTYLNIAAQAGLIGVVSFAFLIYWVMRSSHWSPVGSDTNRRVHFALSTAFGGAFLYQGMAGSFEDARHLWVLIGMIVAVSGIANPKTAGEKETV